jgi:hypothetical protein
VCLRGNFQDREDKKKIGKDGDNRVLKHSLNKFYEEQKKRKRINTVERE